MIATRVLIRQLMFLCPTGFQGTSQPTVDSTNGATGPNNCRDALRHVIPVLLVVRARLDAILAPWSIETTWDLGVYIKSRDLMT